MINSLRDALFKRNLTFLSKPEVRQLRTLNTGA